MGITSPTHCQLVIEQQTAMIDAICLQNQLRLFIHLHSLTFVTTKTAYGPDQKSAVAEGSPLVNGASHHTDDTIQDL